MLRLIWHKRRVRTFVDHFTGQDEDAPFAQLRAVDVTGFLTRIYHGCRASRHRSVHVPCGPSTIPEPDTEPEYSSGPSYV